MHIELGLLKGNIMSSRKDGRLEVQTLKVLMATLKKNEGLCTGGFMAIEF